MIVKNFLIVLIVKGQIMFMNFQIVISQDAITKKLDGYQWGDII